MKKFTMELIWHNCKECPPTEMWNNGLYLTDGNFVEKTKYRAENGWYDERTKSYLPAELLHKYWWADLQQTVRGEPKFVTKNA